MARDWQHAWRPGGHPHGAALVAAAVDCRRAGLTDPVPVDLLAALAKHYLDAHGGTALRPEPLDATLAWATKPARGASSLLMPASENQVLAFDYLIDLVSEPVPVPVWLALVDWCQPEQALGIGLTARRVSRFEAAEVAFGKAVDAAVPGATAAQAELVGSGGDPQRAIALLIAALAEMPPTDVETLSLRSLLARFTHKIDKPDMARRMFAELLDDCQARLGPDHADTLEVRLQAAIQLGESRSPADAVRRLTGLVEDCIRVYGADHHATLRVRQQHAAWTDRHGERAQALELFTRLLADRVRVQGPDHPNVLSTRYAIAVRTRDAGDPERTIEVLRELLQDSIRLLGAHHPHTMFARYRLGLSARDAGEVDLAAEQLGTVLEA